MTAKHECCCVEMSCGSCKILVTSIFRSPNSDLENNKLLQLMQEVSELNVQYKVVLGDFNQSSPYQVK